jgi:hypothetical protein
LYQFHQHIPALDTGQQKPSAGGSDYSLQEAFLQWDIVSNTERLIWEYKPSDLHPKAIGPESGQRAYIY